MPGDAYSTSKLEQKIEEKQCTFSRATLVSINLKDDWTYYHYSSRLDYGMLLSTYALSTIARSIRPYPLFVAVEKLPGISAVCP